MNSNSVAGFYNLPTFTVTVNTALRTLVVPAAGTYAGLPSPGLPVGSAISIGLSDISGSNAFDGHPFKITIAGVVSNPGTGNFTATLLQLPRSGVGVIGTTGGVTALGTSTGTAAVSLGTFVSGATLNTLAGGNFYTERVMIWDSSTGILGHLIGLEFWNLGVTTTNVAAAAATCINAGTTMTNLNFILAFQFATANAANTVKINEFTIQRV